MQNTIPASEDAIVRGGDSDYQILGSDAAFLRSSAPLKPFAAHGSIGFVDLFSGCGGLSLGVSNALRGHGIAPLPLSAVDFEKPAMDVYAANFGSENARLADVSHLMPMAPSEAPSDYERTVLAAGKVGVLVGGPPCQGHSDLNNFTRRDDPRNLLYLYMVRAATAMRPDAVLIENVQGSPHDSQGVVHRTVATLVEAGYHVDTELVDMTTIGVAQSRRRYLILGTLKPVPRIADMLAPYRTEPRDLRWAIGDLEDMVSDRIDHLPAKPSVDNLRRIEYLHDHDLFDLPNSERPPCHRDKAHSYNSVYGRLSWNKPAPTITSGFYSPSMGRYVHPSKRRTLTAREAARIQFFPDSFDFSAAKSRTHLAKMIGNAVPMKLTYAIVDSLVRLGALGVRP